MNSPNKPLPLGKKTKWGTIHAVGVRGGERYYMLVNKWKVVTLLPWYDLEEKI